MRDIRFRLRSLARLSMFGLAWLGQAGLAQAATFSVTPTRIVLAPTATSAVVALSNSSNVPMRFQLSAFAWDQTEGGQVVLLDTKDVVVYPSLVTVAPGESRRIRVAVSAPAAVIERSYRLFVEELPNHADAPSPQMGVSVRTKMGIPIFVTGPKQTPRVAVTSLELVDGALVVRVSNDGTAHTVLDQIRVRGESPSGEELFTRTVNGWYLLAGRGQVFSIAIPSADCAAAAAFTVIAESADGRPSRHVPVHAPNCSAK